MDKGVDLDRLPFILSTETIQFIQIDDNELVLGVFIAFNSVAPFDVAAERAADFLLDPADPPGKR